ncbi:hypothetical protein [Yersinia mollaretii]|uniref:hypothetical protein n=1 Tax=Yersinia mollaretii TaxID=33060 RepID=UPI0011A8CFC1|nr:hypothetical protein [Yersinia mollaretii]
MMDWLYATAMCTAVFAYWVFCRSQALKHQEKAVQMIEIFFADETLSDKEKTKMYMIYWLLRYWFSLPLMLIIALFFIIYSMVSNKYTPENLANENSAEFDKLFSTLMQMYIARNPILSTIFMSLLGVIFAVSLVIGTMLNKAFKIPNHAMLASDIIAKLITLKHKIRHAH